jgi:hypothetical protein
MMIGSNSSFVINPVNPSLNTKNPAHWRATPGERLIPGLGNNLMYQSNLNC